MDELIANGNGCPNDADVNSMENTDAPIIANDFSSEDLAALPAIGDPDISARV